MKLAVSSVAWLAPAARFPGRALHGSNAREPCSAFRTVSTSSSPRSPGPSAGFPFAGAVGSGRGILLQELPGAPLVRFDAHDAPVGEGSRDVGQERDRVEPRASGQTVDGHRGDRTAAERRGGIAIDAVAVPGELVGRPDGTTSVEWASNVGTQIYYRSARGAAFTFGIAPSNAITPESYFCGAPLP